MQYLHQSSSFYSAITYGGSPEDLTKAQSCDIMSIMVRKEQTLGCLPNSPKHLSRIASCFLRMHGYRADGQPRVSPEGRRGAAANRARGSSTLNPDTTLSPTGRVTEPDPGLAGSGDVRHAVRPGNRRAECTAPVAASGTVVGK